MDQQSLYDRSTKEQEATRDRLYSINNQQKQQLKLLQDQYDNCSKLVQKLENDIASRDVTIENDKVFIIF